MLIHEFGQPIATAKPAEAQSHHVLVQVAAPTERERCQQEKENASQLC